MDASRGLGIRRLCPGHSALDESGARERASARQAGSLLPEPEPWPLLMGLVFPSFRPIYFFGLDGDILRLNDLLVAVGAG